MNEELLFKPEHRIKCIISTSKRPSIPEYSILANREMLDRFGLRSGELAAITFRHPSLDHDISLEKRMPRYLAVYGRVFIREKIPSDAIAVDQTIRNALGIPLGIFPDMEDGEYHLVPVEESLLQNVRRQMADLFGIRYLMVRCQNASVPDTEKNYVRVPSDILKTLGIQEGDDLIIERPVAVDVNGIIEKFSIISLKISAFSASENFLKERSFFSAEFPKRYPSSQQILYDYSNFLASRQIKRKSEIFKSMKIEPDIPPIFMDRDTREKGTEKFPNAHEADFLTPFTIRRSVRSAAARDALQTGIAFLITLMQFTLAFKPSGFWQVASGVVLAAMIGCGLLILRLRQQI